MLDDIPLKGEDKKEFKKFIYGLNYDKGFQKGISPLQRKVLTH